jgi:hypothetical protein
MDTTGAASGSGGNPTMPENARFVGGFLGMIVVEVDIILELAN